MRPSRPRAGETPALLRLRLELDGAAGAGSFDRGVGELQPADSLRGADRRRGAGSDRGDEMVELAAVGLGVALEKEGEGFFADDAVGAGKGDRALDDIAGP